MPCMLCSPAPAPLCYRRGLVLVLLLLLSPGLLLPLLLPSGLLPREFWSGTTVPLLMLSGRACISACFFVAAALMIWDCLSVSAFVANAVAISMALTATCRQGMGGHSSESGPGSLP